MRLLQHMQLLRRGEGAKVGHAQRLACSNWSHRKEPHGLILCNRPSVKGHRQAAVRLLRGCTCMVQNADDAEEGHVGAVQKLEAVGGHCRCCQTPCFGSALGQHCWCQGPRLSRERRRSTILQRVSGARNESGTLEQDAGPCRNGRQRHERAALARQRRDAQPGSELVAGAKARQPVSRQVRRQVRVHVLSVALPVELQDHVQFLSRRSQGIHRPLKLQLEALFASSSLNHVNAELGPHCLQIVAEKFSFLCRPFRHVLVNAHDGGRHMRRLQKLLLA
mmetsp:Transcript_89128/g.230030  ORF Transcript_89128/g.230030 Transcript_89128/m.230030 type:complete len:278 (-) Transcript_89128:173-1006(-)